MHLPTITFLDTAANVPVRNILCIGRNYVKHAQELGNDIPDAPIVFIKPVSSVITEGTPIVLPSFSSDVHYETELVVLIGKRGMNIPVSDAMQYVSGYGVGLDLTARDVQNALKDKGLPWTISKGFDTAACLSKFMPAKPVASANAMHFTMELNGTRRQTGDTSLMIFPVPQLIAYLSTVFTLDSGDLIFTGTPEGVGPLRSGDRIHMALEDRIRAEFTVA